MVEPSRWEDARSVIDGAPTAGAYARRRASVRRRAGIVVVCVLVSLVIAVLLVATGVHFPGGDRPSGPSHETASLVLLGVGLVVEAVGLVRLLRDKPGLVWNSPLTALTFGQRRELTRAVRRNTAVTPERQDLAVFLAHRLRRQRPMLLMLAGLTLSTLAQATSGHVVQVVAAVIMLVLTPVAALLVLRDERLAGRWLADHGPADD